MVNSFLFYRYHKITISNEQFVSKMNCSYSFTISNIVTSNQKLQVLVALMPVLQNCNGHYVVKFGTNNDQHNNNTNNIWNKAFAIYYCYNRVLVLQGIIKERREREREERGNIELMISFWYMMWLIVSGDLHGNKLVQTYMYKSESIWYG